MHTRPTRRGTLAVVAVLAGVVATLFVGEVTLRILLPSHEQYYVWPPNLSADFHPNPQIIPGITGPSRFRINSSGIRGAEFADDQEHRILAVGGSTTECLFLDEEETWTYLLQERLTTLVQRRVWVGNVGKSGRNTRDHILHIKYLLSQYPTVHTIVALVGINDLLLRLTDSHYDPQYPLRPVFEQEQQAHAFSVTPSPVPPYHYSRMGWWRAARQVKKVLREWRSGQELPVQDATGNMYVAWRENRKHAAELLDEVPDLAVGLEEYRRNLETMADLADRQSIRLILITQPTMWKADLTEQERDLLWMGWTGPSQSARATRYYSVEAMEKAMNRYNDTLLSVCEARKLTCIDLARQLPKDTTVFYDDVHFNESGARQVAAIITNHLSGARLPARLTKAYAEVDLSTVSPKP